MMQSHEATPMVRRGLWMILWLIVIVAVLWALVWLVFFRNSPAKISTLNGSNTKQTDTNSSSGGTTSGSTGNAGGSSQDGQAGSSPATASTSSSQLANAGAGNVFVPFVVASVAGSALYYVRLRRKLAA